MMTTAATSNTTATMQLPPLLYTFILCLYFLTPCTTLSSASSSTSSLSGKALTNVYLTFYGYDDNDDGKGHYNVSIISDPSRHQKATEDLGTYDQPSTFATDYTILKAGTLIYIPKLIKYYIMEDTCVECTNDAHTGKTRIDLYIGGNNG